MAGKGSPPQDTVIRRLVVEYGHWYVYLYMTDGTGKVLDEDLFRQPFRLDRKDAAEEAVDGYQNVYQWILDTTVFSASNEGKPPDLEKPPSED